MLPPPSDQGFAGAVPFFGGRTVDGSFRKISIKFILKIRIKYGKIYFNNKAGLLEYEGKTARYHIKAFTEK